MGVPLRITLTLRGPGRGGQTNDAGEGGETLATSAEWTVNGSAKNLNSGAIDDFGHVSLKKDADRFIEQITLYNVECVTPAPEPGQPDTITYGRVAVAFEAR